MEKEFKIKFNGDSHEIDARVLINSLVHTTTIIEQANLYLDSGKKIDVKIKALEKGSFLIHIDLIEQVIPKLKNLLTRQNAEVAGLLITALVDIIGIHKALKGKEPAQKKSNGKKTTIKTEEGNVINIENFLVSTNN